MTTSTIRPVTRRFPASQDCLDESNLPFSCVLSPLFEEEEEDEYESTFTSGNNNHNNNHSTRTTIHAIPAPLMGISKCLHCGAPHPDTTTHFVLGGSSLSSSSSSSGQQNMAQQLLCFLCGRVSSLKPSEQQAARAPFEGTTTTTTTGGSSSSSTSAAQGTSSARHRPHNSTTFALPLRLTTLGHQQHHHHQTTAAAGGLLSHHPTTTMTSPLYSVPAMTCPPLWFLVLDGSCTERLYWQTVSQVLLQTLQQAPSHLHISLLIANQRQQQQQQQPITTVEKGDDRDDESPTTLEESSVAIYQLNNSATTTTTTPPHVLQYSSNAALSRQEDLLQAVVDSLVPFQNDNDDKENSSSSSSNSKSHVLTAIRSLVEYMPEAAYSNPEETTTATTTTTTATTSSGSSNSTTTTTTTTTSHAPPVAWMTQVILAALETTAVPAGQRHRDHAAITTTSTTTTATTNMQQHQQQSSLRPYMGGKITYFLSKRPAGLSQTTTTTRNNKTPPAAAAAAVVVGDMGGFGGRVRQEPAGSRFMSASSMMNHNNHTNENHDHSSSSSPPVVENGTSEDNDDDDDNDVEQNRPTASGDNSSSSSSAVEWTPTGLEEHYRPSEPNVELYYADLGRQCAEAALGVDLLCLVTTEKNDQEDQGSDIPTNPDFGLALCQGLSDKSGAPGPLLFDMSSSLRKASVARLQQELLARSPWQPGRVFGAELRIRLSPGFEVDHQSVEYENKYKTEPQLAPLYCEAGLVGPATPVEDSTHLWRMGTSDQFTSLTVDFALQRRRIKDRFIVDGYGEVSLRPVIQTCLAYTTIVQDDEGNYHTVRRMRIASQPVPLTDRVEDLYDSLDPEALAVVLFHKLAIASFQEGLLEAPIIAQSWLQSLLACAYHSAEEQALLETEEAEKGIGDEQKSTSRYFVASERLLDRDGALPAEDVLLAQGHKKLAPIPLMVFLLLQSDPLRPDPTVSLDLRVAALWQMASMLPTNLARAIAPRLQLWASGNGDNAEEPILDIIDLSSTAVQDAVMEYIQQQKVSHGILLFLDSPDQILVMDARRIVSDQVAPVVEQPKRSSSWFGGGSSSHKRDAEQYTIGVALEQAIQEAAESYRTRPIIQYALKDDSLLSRLADVLVEDAPMGEAENFAAWRQLIASAVNEDLLETA